MSTRETKARIELLQATLDLLILHALILRPQHGQGIARAIQQTPDEELLVEHRALYPRLNQLQERGWISPKWEILAHNRKPGSTHSSLPFDVLGPEET